MYPDGNATGTTPDPPQNGLHSRNMHPCTSDYGGRLLQTVVATPHRRFTHCSTSCCSNPQKMGFTTVVRPGAHAACSTALHAGCQQTKARLLVDRLLLSHEQPEPQKNSSQSRSNTVCQWQSLGLYSMQKLSQEGQTPKTCPHPHSQNQYHTSSKPATTPVQPSS